MKKARVLIVDDSAVVQKVLTEIFRNVPDLEVVGTATDPYIAREEIKRLKPDVLTLDVEMPRMDGVTFLKNLMRLHPLPVVMISSLTESGAEVTLRALELGAIDFVTKPKLNLENGLREYAEEIVTKVRAAAKARPRPPQDLDRTGSVQKPADRALAVASALRGSRASDRIIGIGASTGGTEAIRQVLEGMPEDAPGIVIVQHIPESFCPPFVRRLDSSTSLKVSIPEDGQPVLQGHAYVAPGHLHMRVERVDSRYICRLDDGPLVNRHKPSVDVLFNSLAKCAGGSATGVLLTGMGADGALGLKAMKEAGAGTVAQDEKTCVVWGMPAQAVKIGAADIVLPLHLIAAQSLIFAAR